LRFRHHSIPNEGICIAATAENFPAVLPPGNEVIVVDDATTDGSAEAIRANPRIYIMHLRILGPARARNLFDCASSAPAATGREDL
jgi:glycosyltransferase involved in cell wall biosynthesis